MAVADARVAARIDPPITGWRRLRTAGGQHQASGAGDGRSSADPQGGEPGRADEVLQLLVGAAEQLAVEDQVTLAHRLLAVLLDEHAPDRLLVGRGRRAAAGPALLAVARLDLVSEKEGLLPKVEPAARVGLDREAVDEPVIADQQRQQHGMARDLRPFELVVDAGTGVRPLVVAEPHRVQAARVGRAGRVLAPAVQRAGRVVGAGQADIALGRQVAHRHADAEVAEVVLLGRVRRRARAGLGPEGDAGQRQADHHVACAVGPRHAQSPLLGAAWPPPPAWPGWYSWQRRGTLPPKGPPSGGVGSP